MSLPDHLVALRDEALQTSCESWALRCRWRLAPGIDRAGPCPNCGGEDRFAIHVKKNTFLCRRCGISGEGVIKLVMLTQGVEFTEACEIVTGRAADAPIDPAKAEAIARDNARREAERARDAHAYRERAREEGYKIWRSCAPRDQRDVVAEYLALRGLLTADLMHWWGQICLWQGQQNYTVMVDRMWQRIHTGPVMVAAVQMPNDRFGAAHMTWLDLNQPKGKVELAHPSSGEAQPSKKVRGVKKGGAMRLLSVPNATRIVMGEGIETTLTALAHNFEPDTNYWAGVDLGNMSGKARRDAAGKQIHDEPDLDDDDCFLPPDWCRELVYLAETDAPENHTTDKIKRGLKRAQILRRRAQEHDPSLPDLVTSFIEGPEAGGDLNDLVRGGA